jgi:uncharacterized membrane protein YeiB
MEGLFKDKQVRVGGLGAILAFLGCMTPMILVPMAFIGIGAWFTPLNKFVIVPLIVVFSVIMSHGFYRHFRRGPSDSESEPEN